jgi:hypothetical protein
MTSKCIHVVATHEPPELVEFTTPLFESYASKVGAELRFINERKFAQYPANYERMQVYESGREFSWNMVIDGGVLIGPLLHDFTRLVDRRRVGLCLCSHAANFFKTTTNRHFIRDGRDLGFVETIIVTSALTHDLWEPLPGGPDDWLPQILSGDPKLLSEFCLSQNAARFRFDILNPFASPAQLYRIENRARTTREMLQEASKVVDSWGLRL